MDVESKSFNHSFTRQLWLRQILTTSKEARKMSRTKETETPASARKNRRNTGGSPYVKSFNYFHKNDCLGYFLYRIDAISRMPPSILCSVLKERIGMAIIGVMSYIDLLASSLSPLFAWRSMHYILPAAGCIARYTRSGLQQGAPHFVGSARIHYAQPKKIEGFYRENVQGQRHGFTVRS